MATPPPSGNNNNIDLDDRSINSLVNRLRTALTQGINDALSEFDETKYKFGQKDLVAGFREVSKISEKILENRLKINKGEMSSLEINKQIRDFEAKRSQILRQQEELKQKGYNLSEDLVESLKEEQKAYEANLSLLRQQSLEAAKTYSTFNELVASSKEIGINLDGVFSKIWAYTKEIDKSTGNLAKSLNASYDAAYRYRQQLNEAAESSGHIYATGQKMAQAAVELNEQYGLSAKYDANKLDAYIKLAQYSGYDKETQADILRYSYLTGKSVDQINGSRLATIKIVGALSGKHLSEKVVMQDIAKASAAIKLSMMSTPGAIEKAAATARSFAVSMGQTEKMAENLMNFEGSIQKQMEAEVLTGQTLNLERARYAALTNDVAGMVTELNSQGITSSKFASMNRIQQHAIAESLGMQRDEMAQMLMDQDLASKIGAKDLDTVKAKYLEQVKLGKGQEYLNTLGNSEVQRQLESATQQERITILTEKLLSTVDKLFTAFKPIIDGMISFAEFVGKSETALKGISVLIGAMALSKLWTMGASFARNMTTVATSLGGNGGAGLSKMLGGTPDMAGSTGGGFMGGLKQFGKSMTAKAGAGLPALSKIGAVLKGSALSSVISVLSGMYEYNSLMSNPVDSSGKPLSKKALAKKVGDIVMGSAGNVVGGIIGAALGGPVGSMVGSVGGGWLMNGIANNYPDAAEYIGGLITDGGTSSAPALAEGGLVTQTGMAKVDSGEVYLGANSLQILKDLVTETRQQNQYLQALVKKDTHISMDGQAVAGVVARNVITSYGNLLNPSSATYA